MDYEILSQMQVLKNFSEVRFDWFTIHGFQKSNLKTLFLLWLETY